LYNKIREEAIKKLLLKKLFLFADANMNTCNFGK